MRLYVLISTCLLGLPLVACNGEAPTEASSTQGFQDDADLHQKMEAGKLAELTVGDGKVAFYELEPGEVTVAKNFPIGSKLPSVANEDKLSLAQLYAAYAPGQPIPQRVLDASSRTESPPSPADESAARAWVPEREESRGTLPAANAQRSDIATTKQALDSSIDEYWFESTYCTYLSGTTTCFPLAYNGAYSQSESHTTLAGLCADTGSAYFNMSSNGRPSWGESVPYGSCTAVIRHESHSWTGGHNTTMMRAWVSGAQQTVRFFAHYSYWDCYIV